MTSAFGTAADTAIAQRRLLEAMAACIDASDGGLHAFIAGIQGSVDQIEALGLPPQHTALWRALEDLAWAVINDTKQEQTS